jgi:fermentation-respiration switch protein FrsA (DUF1100 family)
MIDRIAELNRIQSLLLIYSETDDYTPVSMGLRFKNKSNVPAELWTVKNAEHAKIIKSEHRAEYEQKLTTFIETCLRTYKDTDAAASAIERSDIDSKHP